MVQGMPRFTALRRGALRLALFCGVCTAQVCSAQTDDSSAPISGDVISIVSQRMNLEIPERFAKVVTLPKKVLRVHGFDPAVLNVTALAPDKLLITALAQGITNVVITDEDGEAHYVEVFVTGDARLFQNMLNRTYPNTAVQAIAVRNSVLLRGWVTQPQDIPDIVALAELYFPDVLNQMRVAGPQEVQLRVKVMEVQRSLTRKMGLNFAYFNQNAAIISSPGAISAVNALTAPLGGPPTGGFNTSGLQNNSLSIGFADSNNAFLGLVEALKQEGLLKLHAETTLTTRNGEPAEMNSGGEFPIPVPQSLGTVTIQWRKFGVILQSLPVVISPTRLRQQVSVEVSERDSTTAVTLNGTTVPGLNKRQVMTQAEMNFGDTMVIGGMIFTRYTGATSKLPFFGELPGIGTLFRRNNYTEAETELIVMITPEYVAPMSSDQVPPGGPTFSTDIPTDRELYFQGVIEVPSYGGRAPNMSCPPGEMIPASGTMPTMSPEMIPPSGFDPNFIQPTLPGSPAPSGNEPMLITPPGLQPPPPAPPLPDQASIQKGSSRTAWPSTSSSQQLSSQSSSSGSGVRQVGYQKGTSKTSRSSGVSRAAYQPSLNNNLSSSSLKTAQ